MNKLSFLFAFLMLVSFTGFSQKSPKTAEAKFQTSAVCGMCKKRIERDLGLTKGVEAVNLNLDNKVVTVAYNPKKTSPEDLKKAISQIGYDADNVVADDKAHDRLPGCCQKTAASH